jgi:hypothetical protein
MNEPTFGPARTRRPIESRATLTVPGWHASDFGECGAVRSDARDLVQLYADRLAACRNSRLGECWNSDYSMVAFGTMRHVGRGTDAHSQHLRDIEPPGAVEANLEHQTH